MSRTIDERIVEMEFQNAQFERGIQTSIKSLDALKKGLDLEGAEKGLDNLSRSANRFSMSGLTGAIEAVSGKFTAMEVVAITALQRITNQAMDAGERLIKSLSIDQITAGFSKYTDKTKSVNTIVNATGKDVDYVNERLEKLNWFTDETSYNFNDMVSNIGKFTSAGVDLDKATTAMMGIATEAALSGQGINEASRAMYNFAQAIGVGQVKLMDWRSIENANMATKEFKETIIETAKSLGTLDKATSKTKKGTTVTFQNFTETLQEGWFTSEVLIESLKKYGEYAEEVYKVSSKEGITAAQAMEKLGDAGMELGAKAFKAAQVARTFTDAIEATKDAVSSGWMQSFELIFGDVNESAELWTDVTNALWEVFAAGAEKRNEVLKAWHDASEGGRADLLQGLYDSFESLWNIITAVKEALSEVFPVDWTSVLTDASLKVKEYGENLKKTFGVSEKIVQQETEIEKIVPNFYEQFDGALKKGSKGEGVKAMQERLEKLGYDLGKWGVDGIFGPKTEEALKKFQKDANQTIDGIYTEATHIDVLGALYGTHAEVEKVIQDIVVEEPSEALERLKNIARGVFTIFKIGFESVKAGFSIVREVLKTVSPLTSALGKLGGTVLQLFSNWIQGLQTSEMFSKWIENVRNFLKPVSEWFEKAGAIVTDFFGLDLKYSTFDEFWAHIEESLGKYKTVGAIWNGIKTLFNSIKKTVLDFILVTDSEGNRLGFFDSIRERLSALKPIIDWLSNAIKTLFGFGQEDVSNLEGVEENLTKTESIFTRIASIFDYIAEIWNKTKQKILESGVIDELSKAWAKFKDSIIGLWPRIQESISAVSDSLFGEGVSPIDWLKEKIPEWATAAVEGLTSVVEFLADKLRQLPDLINAIKEFFKSIFSVEDQISQGEAYGPPKPKQKGYFERGLERIGSIFTTITKFLPVMGVVAGAALVIAGAIKAVKLVTSLLEAFTTAKYGYEPNKKKKPIADSILEIAASIAIIAGAIYIIGSLDDKAFAQGAITVGVITAALLAITLAFSKLGDNGQSMSNAGKGLREMATAIGILAAIMWVFGNASWEQMGKGALVVVGIMTLLGVFMAAMNKLNASSFNVSGLIGMSVAIGIIAAIVWVVGNMNGKKAVKGLLVVGAIMLLLAAFAKIARKAGSQGIKMGGFIGLAAAIAIIAYTVGKLGKMGLGQLALGLAAVTIIGLIIGALMKMSSSSQLQTGPIIAMALGLAAVIGVFGYVIDQIRDIDPTVMISFSGSLSLIVVALTAAFLAVSKLGGGFGQMAGAAASLGTAFAILVAIVGAVVAGIGYLNEATEGDLVSYIESGGEVLAALADALTPFETALDNALFYAGAIAAVAVAGIIGVPGVVGGAAAIGLAFTILTGITTATLAGLGALSKLSENTDGKTLKEYIEEGGEVLREVGAALASFGSGFQSVATKNLQDYAKAMDEARNAISGLADQVGAGEGEEGEEDGPLIKDLKAAFAISDKIVAYFETLTPYESFAFSGIITPYTSAANQLATDMGAFGEGLGKARDAISGLAEKAVTDEQVEFAINCASSLHTFFSGLEPYKVSTLALFGSYFTAPEQLSTDMQNFATAISEFASKVGGLTVDYQTLDADTNEAIGIAGKVKQFFDDINKESDKLNGLTMATYYSNVTGLFQGMEDMAGAIDTLKEKIADLHKTDLSADTAEAIKIAGQVVDFVVDLKKVIIPLNRSWLEKVFVAPNQVETIFEDVANLGTVMHTAAGKLTGLAESDFELNFNSAMLALGAMARFLNKVGTYKNIQPDPGWLSELFIGKTETQTVFQKVGELGEIMKGMIDDLAGLGTSSFTTDFKAAMGAVDLMATFLNKIGTWKVEGTFGTGSDFNEALFPIQALGDMLTQFQADASGVDLEGFTSTVETITAGLDSVATAFTNFATVSGPSSVDTIFADFVTSFNDIGSEMTENIADGMDEGDVTTAMTTVLGAALDVAETKAKRFFDVGEMCSRGLAQGISSGADWVKNAAASVMQRAINAAKKVADQASPSKVFYEMGMYNDLGLANGMVQYGRVVEAASAHTMQGAIDTAGSMFANLTDLITEDMDTTPVIRPVLDLSAVASGASAMGSYFRSPLVEVSTSQRLAGSILSGSSGSLRVSGNSGSDAVSIVNTLHAEFRDMTDAISRMQFVTETGAVIGAIGPGMDRYLGERARTQRRR